MIWYPSTPVNTVEDKLATLLEEVKKINLDRKPMTISIGSCYFELSSGDTRNERMSVLDSLIKVADECLYVANKWTRSVRVSSILPIFR